MKKLTKFELIAFSTNIICYIILLFFNLSWLNSVAFASSCAFVVANLFMAKGNWAGCVFSILSYVLYYISCISYNYYGELFYSIFLTIMQFFILFSWKKNKKSDDIVVIKKCSKFELYISILSTLVLIVLMSLLLKVIGSEYVILNALSLVLTLLSTYYALRRYKIQFIVSLISGIFFEILWILTVVAGSTDGLIYVVGGIYNLIWAVYGLINWKKIEKSQKLNIELKIQ